MRRLPPRLGRRTVDLRRFDMALEDTIARIQAELYLLEEALQDSSRAGALVRIAVEALDKVPAALEHDRYQDAVSAHQLLVARRAPDAEVHASYEALMARLARLPPE